MPSTSTALSGDAGLGCDMREPTAKSPTLLKLSSITIQTLHLPDSLDTQHLICCFVNPQHLGSSVIASIIIEVLPHDVALT